MNDTKGTWFLEDKMDKKKSNFVDEAGNFYILGEFDESISQNIVPNLIKKIAEEEDKPNPQIWFYINSNGGYCHELYNILTLLDIAKAKGIRIYTVVTGRAYSCGSMLAMHGDHRAIFKYGKHLMHLGEAGTLNHTFKQLERETNTIKEHFENIVKMYIENTKIPEKQIREMLLDDSCFLNAEECKKYGLVDEIIGEEIPDPVITVADNDSIVVNGMRVKIKIDEKRQAKEKEKQKKKEAKEKEKQEKKSKKEKQVKETKESKKDNETL